MNTATHSKINWTSLAGPAAAWAAYIGLDVTPEQLVAVVLGVQAFQSVLVIIFRTWFTGAPK